MKNVLFPIFLFLTTVLSSNSIFGQSRTSIHNVNSVEVETYQPDNQNRQVKELDIQLPMRNTRRTRVEIVNNMAIYEGDIVLGHAAKFSGEVSNGIAIASNNYRWTDGIIPYTIAAGHPRKDDIIKAIEHVKTKTNICMVERTNERDYVKFISGSGCWSYVGRQMFEQYINIGTCSLGSIIHEISHAAGMYHEQSRSDRDQYIEIKWENIKDKKDNNFKTKAGKATDIGPYDFGSIMHYPAKAFSKNGKPTIVSKVGAKAFGQRIGLSPMDISALNSLYPDAMGCGNGLIPTPGGNTSTGGSTTTTTGNNTTQPPTGTGGNTTTTTGNNTTQPPTGTGGNTTTTTGNNSTKPTSGRGGNTTTTGNNSNKPPTGTGGNTTTTTGNNSTKPTSGRGGNTTTTTGNNTTQPPTGTGGNTTTTTGNNSTKPTSGRGGNTTTTTGNNSTKPTSGRGGNTTTTGNNNNKPTSGRGGGTRTNGNKPPTTQPTRGNRGGAISKTTGQTGESGSNLTVAFYSEKNYQGEVVHLKPGKYNARLLLKQFKNGNVGSIAFDETKLTVILHPYVSSARVHKKDIPDIYRFHQIYQELIIRVNQ